MKVRKKNLCDTCRKRKLQCDGKRPACTQCLFSKRTCEGYPEALFVPFITTKAAIKPRTTRQKPVSRTSQSVPASARFLPVADSDSAQHRGPPTPSRTDTSESGSLPSEDQCLCTSTIQYKVAFILRNFIPTDELQFAPADAIERCSQFCGAWALALPELTADMTDPFAQCLHSAVSVLALSVSARQSRERFLDAVVSQYEESLRLLSSTLAVAGDICNGKLVAAVMCLALTEIFSPTLESSWLVHVEGVVNMVQLMPPEAFVSGVNHTMLMGFRPLVILRAFMLRKPTFFADELWLTQLFRCHQPAALQSLLGVAAHIPNILEKVDVILPRSCDRAAATADQLITELMGSISRLKAWHSSYLANTPEVPVCSRKVEREHGTIFESLWFHSLGTANVFIYFWAFQIVCLTEIQDLLDRFPHLKHAVHDGAAYGTEALQEDCLELSTCIYKSMEYLLRPECMLYGILSAGFPLGLACKTLQSDPRGRAILETLDHSILTRARIREGDNFLTGKHPGCVLGLNPDDTPG